MERNHCEEPRNDLVAQLKTALEVVKSWDMGQYMENGKFSLPIKVRKIIADALGEVKE